MNEELNRFEKANGKTLRNLHRHAVKKGETILSLKRWLEGLGKHDPIRTAVATWEVNKHGAPRVHKTVAKPPKVEKSKKDKK